MFKQALPREHLLTNLIECSTEYKEDIVKILKICLSKFEQGFHKQKGAIFGFGSSAVDDTGSILKISSLEDKALLQTVPVHNLGEEKSVGLLNYELDFRGR